MSPPEPSTNLITGEGLLPRPNRVKIVNSVCNDQPFIRRRTAENFVLQGRAVWVSNGQLRMIESHPKNIAAAGQAIAWQNEPGAEANGWKFFDQARLEYGDKKTAGQVAHLDHGEGIPMAPRSNGTSRSKSRSTVPTIDVQSDYSALRFYEKHGSKGVIGTIRQAARKMNEMKLT